MTDIATISSILSSIKTATDIAKLIKESDISLEKAETKLKLADLISSLADARIEIANIQEMLISKDQSIKELKESINIKEKLNWESPYYWLMDGSKKEGPFCQHCYDDRNKLIRLQGDNSGYWECKTCKNSYTDSSYEQSGSFYFQPE